MNSNQRQPTGGAPRRRARKVALWAGAGFFGLALIGTVTSHPSTQPTAQVGSVATSSSHGLAAAVHVPSVVPATTTSSAPTSTTAAPTIALSCPSGGTVASPVFGHQISAVGSYTVAIDYGDGDRYSNDAQHLNAVFSHTYKSAGSFSVTAVVQDASGQSATSGCTYSWTAAAPAPRKAPVPATGGGSGGASGNSYTNVDGNRVSGPVSAAAPPPGATAQCKDGTYSFSQHHQGTCSGHGGVAQWL